VVGDARTVKKDIFQAGGLDEPEVFLFVEPFNDAFTHFSIAPFRNRRIPLGIYQKKSRATSDSAIRVRCERSSFRECYLSLDVDSLRGSVEYPMPGFLKS
jgi:hypothetical protein